VQRSGPFGWGRVGLRTRIALLFTLGAAVLSLVLSSVTYFLVRSALVEQREQRAIDLAFANARLVQQALESNPASVQPILTGLPSPGSSRPLVFYRGEWTALTSEYGRDSVPETLRTRVVDDGVAAVMLSGLNGQPVLAVGIPMPLVGAAYFELGGLDDIDDTLASVAISLAGASVLTIGLGALLGGVAARRAVKPLADAAQAARAIAGGRLDTRLEPADDQDLGALSNAFNDMASALQQRVERDARFASDVSHELRSPLMTLSASAEVLESRREEMPEKAQVALDLLVADVSRFKGLVEDLLEISRFDAGAVRLHLEEFGVAEFVRMALAISSVRDATLTTSPLAEQMVINGDKRRLARVVANLVDNARLHGGGEVEVTVTEPADDPAPSTVWIAVEDHGAGVPAEERHLVFERFARGSAAGRRGATDGSGLGLALVDEHVRLHGGRVWVEDRVDGAPGARFVIELPAEEVS
jgi:two-component system, OmpR family, sensor histidine kinase MtrB